MKKKTLIIIGIILVLAAGGYYFYARSKDSVQAVNFVTAKADYGYIAQTVTATGTIEPVDTVSVGAQVSGVVKSVLVDFNDQVKKGQLLGKVDPSIIQAQLEESRAALANANSNLQYQQSNYERQNKLFTLGAISKADYQLALNQYNVARATVNSAAAQVSLAEKNLSYTNIYSPIDGVVLNRNVSEGQTIASSFSAPTLFVLARDLTKMQVRAAVDEADIGGVRSNQNASFTVDAFPKDVFEGLVQEILLHPAVSSNVVTYTTLVNVGNPDLKLKPGMTASIKIYTEEDSAALLIPSKALSFKPDSTLLKNYKLLHFDRSQPAANADKGSPPSHRDSASKATRPKGDFTRSFVWVKTGDSLVEKRILTGINDDSYVKVIKGLSAGEEVITAVTTGLVKTATADNTTRSPFMPQMGRRQGTGAARTR